MGSVARNPIVQTVVTAAICTSGPAGCVAVGLAFAALNAHERARGMGGYSRAVRSRAFWASTSFDVALAFLPAAHGTRVGSGMTNRTSSYGRRLWSDGVLETRRSFRVAFRKNLKGSAVASGGRYAGCKRWKHTC